MTLIRRRIPTSGHGTQIPVRVEDAKSGTSVALTTAAQDGLYEAQVPGGRYRVSERWGRTFLIVVPESGGPFDVGSLAGEDPTTGVMAGEAPADPPEVARIVEQASRQPEPAGEGSERPARTPRDGSRSREASHDPTSSERPSRVPRDGARERAEGPWERVRRGPRVPRDGGRKPAVTRE